MNPDETLTLTALRQLDPAGGPDGDAQRLSAAQARRAELTLQQILASGPGSDRQRPSPARARRRRRWTWAAAATLAAAAAALVPALNGDQRAYASWSPVPTALAQDDAAAAARACLASRDRLAPDPVAPLLAERRGSWAYVLVAAADGSESSCLLPASDATGGARSDPRRWFGSTDDEPTATPPGPDEVRLTTTAVGGTEEGLFAWSEGRVGRDVEAVTFTTPRGVVVHASIGNGRCAAWWPAGKGGVRSPEISEASSVEVTLADGSTRRLRR